MTNPATPNSEPGNTADFDPRPAARRAFWLRIGWVSVLALIMAIPVVLIMFLSLGAVTGKEFSPATFETRRFHYLRIPFTKIAFSNRTIVDESNAFSERFADAGWIVPGNNSAPRWDLVSDNWQVDNSPDFDAAILVAYLEFENANNESVWDLWSNEHPKQADVFWPVIARFAADGIYIPMPDLFRFARDFPAEEKLEPSVNSASFAGRLHALAASLATEHAQREFKAGRHSTARAAAIIAQEHDPAADVKQILDRTGKTDK